MKQRQHRRSVRMHMATRPSAEDLYQVHALGYRWGDRRAKRRRVFLFPPLGDRRKAKRIFNGRRKLFGGLQWSPRDLASLASRAFSPMVFNVIRMGLDEFRALYPERA